MSAIKCDKPKGLELKPLLARHMPEENDGREENPEKERDGECVRFVFDALLLRGLCHANKPYVKRADEGKAGQKGRRVC